MPTVTLDSGKLNDRITSKISEKDTSENIMHTYDTGLLDDVHLNEKHQSIVLFMQATVLDNLLNFHNWETYIEKIFSLQAPAIRFVE